MQTEVIHFFSEGRRISGVVHKPDGAAPATLPVVVQGPGWMETVCSKVSEPFHEGFTRGGYAVLHFDARGWGKSEGEPGWARPQDTVEDIINAITYVETREDLDAGRVALFGLGGTGGGNPIYAAAFDQRVKAVVTQTVVADGATWLRAMRREYEWVAYLDRIRKNARRRVSMNEDELVVPTEEIMVATPERKAAGMPTRGADVHLGSVESLLRYRPLDVVDRIAPRALLIACVENDVVVPEEHARALFDRAGPPKRLIRQTSVSHYDSYAKNYDALMASFLEWLDRYVVDRPIQVFSKLDDEVVEL